MSLNGDSCRINLFLSVIGFRNRCELKVLDDLLITPFRTLILFTTLGHNAYGCVQMLKMEDIGEIREYHFSVLFRRTQRSSTLFFFIGETLYGSHKRYCFRIKCSLFWNSFWIDLTIFLLIGISPGRSEGQGGVGSPCSSEFLSRC